MQFAWRSRFWRSAMVCLGGGLVTILLAYVCFIVRFDFASAGFTLVNAHLSSVCYRMKWTELSA